MSSIALPITSTSFGVAAAARNWDSSGAAAGLASSERRVSIARFPSIRFGLGLQRQGSLIGTGNRTPPIRLSRQRARWAGRAEFFRDRRDLPLAHPASDARIGGEYGERNCRQQAAGK